MPPLREHRLRLNLTQDEVADRLRRLALEIEGRSVAVNAKMISAWEREEKVPSRLYQRLLCRLYEATPAKLGFRVFGVQGDGYPREDVRRRSFIRLAAGVAFGPLLEGARRDFDLAFGQRSIEDWEAAVHAYGFEVVTAPPRAVVPYLIADIDELGGVLHEDRRLAHVAASLSELTASTLVRLGEGPAAQRWWATALRGAGEAGDPTLAAFITGHRAGLALYGDHPARVLDLAEEAIASTAAPCAGLMSGHAARAQALAGMGRDREAMAALAEAEAIFERLPADVTNERVSTFGWPEQRLRYTQSHVSTRLRDTRRAMKAQDQAFALYPRERSRAAARVHLHRAACLIHDGDVTEGTRYATDTLAGLPLAQRTRLVRVVANDVLAAIPEKARDLPPVAEYRDLLAA